ncbi:MAG: thiamine phosphate synthase [Pseudomonadota bacterium]
MVSSRKNIRSRITALAAAAQTLRETGGVCAPFSLAFLTDQTRIPNPEIIARAMPAGAAVVLRDYQNRARAAMARRLRTICTARKAFLIIGADINLAHTVGADGVHLPSWFDAGRAKLDDMIVTASCHTRLELDRAAQQGADLAFLSPVFATRSHPSAKHLGPDAFKDIAVTSPTPILALGGVDETNASQLAGPNVAGLAAIGAFSPR